MVPGTGMENREIALLVLSILLWHGKGTASLIKVGRVEGVMVGRVEWEQKAMEAWVNWMGAQARATPGTVLVPTCSELGLKSVYPRVCTGSDTATLLTIPSWYRGLHSLPNTPNPATFLSLYIE